MIVLGIETTCDETGISIVKDGKEILSNIIASSVDLHQKYGGVFPELACRRHIDVIDTLIYEAMDKAQVTPSEIDLIAVAKGPGLIGALLIGMNVAKGLAISWNKPFIGINHVEAHLYASMMDLDKPQFPSLGIVLSGGHTFLIKILGIGSYEPIATTVDDAIGEAFDKVGNLLGLPYPGGPHIETLAKRGDPKKHPFKAGNVKLKPLDFSFSGLKTSVLYRMRDGDHLKEDIAASFQETAFSDIVRKIGLATKLFPCKSLFFGGGVTANRRLRSMIEEKYPQFSIHWPKGNLSLDNAAMIAGLGAKKYLGFGDALDAEVRARIPIA